MLATIGVRLVHLDQPIVENYVGRQVPTAMVARNLGRGSGFLHPQLDTGPFPNLFLVEPPIFASFVVVIRRLTGLPVGASGRVVSALASGLAAWGLYGLARRRDGVCAALMAVAAFAVFPMTVRYGRACQPDMLMLGFLVAGLRLWDDYEEQGGGFRLVAAWVLVALGLAVKIVAAYVLVPLIFVVAAPRFCRVGRALASPTIAEDEAGGGARCTRPTLQVVTLLSTLLPALCWYAHAALAVRSGRSRASADNAAIWASSLGPLALLRGDALASAARFLILRAFTPPGFLLALWGILGKNPRDRLWLAWGASALAGLAMVGGKLHHEYYWLALAPVAAAGVGRALAPLNCTRIAILVMLCGFCLWQSSSTFRTPPEWIHLTEASQQFGRIVPENGLLVAPEALLFAADRRGCRLEFEPRAMGRAAGEWGGSIDASDPLALVEFYRHRGAKFVADLTTASDPESRRALHEAIRRRYNVIVDRDGVLIAELTDRPGIAPWPQTAPP